MNDKVCENCKWLKWDKYCCRYPEWIEIQGIPSFHYCGEFKERDGK